MPERKRGTRDADAPLGTDVETQAQARTETRMPSLERKRGRRMPSLERKRGRRMPSLGSGRRRDDRGRKPSPRARAAPHSTR